jgi:putative transposase
VTARYEHIDAQKAIRNPDGTARYDIKQMCAWLGVSTSGFYEWLNRPASATARRRERLKTLIVKAFEDNAGRYGYRRVHATLARWGQACTPELVRGLMRELGLVACQPRRSRKGTTRQAAKQAPIPDLINRDFTSDTPGAKLVGDITYSAQLTIMFSPGGDLLWERLFPGGGCAYSEVLEEGEELIAGLESSRCGAGIAQPS